MLASADVSVLMQAWQAGAISYETFYYNLQQGEIARPGVDADTERELVDAQQGSSLLPLGDAAGAGDGGKPFMITGMRSNTVPAGKDSFGD